MKSKLQVIYTRKISQEGPYDQKDLNADKIMMFDDQRHQSEQALDKRALVTNLLAGLKKIATHPRNTNKTIISLKMCTFVILQRFRALQSTVVRRLQKCRR